MTHSYFLSRYENILGEKITPVVLKKSIRVNTLKTTNEKTEEFLRNKRIKFEKISFLENGYYIDDSNFNIVSTKEYLEGFFYIQEAAAQLAVEVLAPVSNDLVLDMCASPGGKSTHIAQRMQNSNALICLESNQVRITRLCNNLERCGVTNAVVYRADARYFEFDKQFDKILLDAPCSGNYAVDEGWLEKKETYVIDELQNIQKTQITLLKHASGLIKRGGIIVYATCSLEPEEDEYVIDYAIKHLGLVVEETNLKIGDDGITQFEKKKFDDSVKYTKRFWPQKTNTQGFFIAKLKKI